MLRKSEKKLEKNLKILLKRARLLKVKIAEHEQALLAGHGAIFCRRKKFSHKLCDFFLPHACNGYRARALHPRRLFLYGALALAAKSILALTMLSLPFTAWLSGDFYLVQKQELGEKINIYRQDNGRPLLAADPRLNQAAFIRAADIIHRKNSGQPGQRGLSSDLKIAGYEFSAAREAIAENFFENGELFQSWSADRRVSRILLDEELSEIGIEIVYDYKTDSNILVLIMAKPVSRAPERVSGPAITGQPGCPESALISGEARGEREGDAFPEDARPRIAKLEEKTITADNEQILEVAAPDAERAMLYVDDREIMLGRLDARPAAEGNACRNNFFVPVRLEEGQHSLMVKSVFGREEIYSINYSITVDNTPPFYSGGKSALKLSGGSAHGRLEASVHLSTDTRSADLQIGNYELPLVRDEKSQNFWFGKMDVPAGGAELFGRPAGGAILTAEDLAGNRLTSKVELPGKTAAAGSGRIYGYHLLKNTNTSALNTILKPSAVILYSLLFIALALAMLNIYIEIHKQRIYLILSSVGIVLLFIVLILI